ncbi:hypothetical protein QBC47DRAFT_376310 [Echria macrotheca]|uniref:Uncharacterized protein n=1 Tax=Echria macrotheca TaxID=438768 RepID=A0AAJ0FBP3_9PEZI|nr:hypothetical protein QBC47DRAFT_376310 [Echria macrotheca]
MCELTSVHPMSLKGNANTKEQASNAPWPTNFRLNLATVHAAFATIGATLASLLADETAAERRKTTLETTTAAALTGWRLLLILHRGLRRIVTLGLGRTAVGWLGVLRVTAAAVVLRRWALLIVLLSRHGGSTRKSEASSGGIYLRANRWTLPTNTLS